MYWDSTFKINTPRDIIEATLLKHFANQLQPANKASIQLIRKVESESSEQCSLELLHYMQGRNQLSKSTNYPQGLIYVHHDELGQLQAAFGIGVFFRELTPTQPVIHLMMPHGSQWQAVVKQFHKTVQENIPDAEVYIRQHTHRAYNKFSSSTKLQRLELQGVYYKNRQAGSYFQPKYFQASG